MNSTSLELKYRNTSLPIQIIKLSDSFYVYVGTTNLNLANLTIGMFVYESSESNKLEFKKSKTLSEVNKENMSCRQEKIVDEKVDTSRVEEITSRGFSCSSVILDEISSYHAKQISERLSYKLGCPIYLSFNIPDEYVDLELKIRLETGLYNYIKDL